MSKSDWKWFGGTTAALVLFVVMAAALARTFTGPLDAGLRYADGNLKTATGVYNVVDLGAGFAPKPIAAMGLFVDITRLDSNCASYVLTQQECATNPPSTDANWRQTGLSFTLPRDANAMQYLKVTGVTQRYQQITLTAPSADGNAYLRTSLWAVPLR